MVESELKNRPLLSASGISKNFEGVYALTGVDFTLNAGEVHALLGANGAGKSTLIKILSGVHKKDSGELRIEGRDVNANDIATVYQELSLIPTLTVWQNIFLCHEIRGPIGTLKVNSMKKVAEELVERLGLHIDVNDVVSNLSIAAQQLVEIAKAVHLEAQVLILDEPTSTLTKSDQIILFERIRSIKKAGVGIIYVTHKLSEVFEIADRVTVLRDGRNVLTTEISKMNMDQLVSEISGSDRYNKKRFSKKKVDALSKTNPLLEIVNLSGDRFSNVNFEVAPGEIVGIAGLIGAGRTEILETIIGVRKKREGSIHVDQSEVVYRDPAQALKSGVALVPEDRRVSGLIMTHSVTQNLILAHQDEAISVGVINRNSSVTITDRSVAALKIKVGKLTESVDKLSGGNQQKVVFAKWLQPKIRILLLDEPTQGVDVGARQEIYEVIRQFAAKGTAVLVVSSDFTELHELCDRLHFISPKGLSESEVVDDEMDDYYINSKVNERVEA